MRTGVSTAIINLIMDKEHAYKKFESDLKAGNIKNVLLLYGKEQYLVKWAVDMLVKKYVDSECRVFDYHVLDPEKTTPDDIVENCETLSFFSEKRVVHLPGFDEDDKRLSDYIKNIPDTCLLVLTSEKADKRKKLYKEAVSHGAAYDFGPLDEHVLKTFIEKRFALLGKKIKPNVTAELIGLSGYYLKETEYTLFNMENEIKKIAAHADGDEIMISDVLGALSGDVETYVFSLIDAVGMGRKEEAFKLLYNILSSGSSIFLILSLLASQYETILEVKELREEGKLTAQMQSILGVHEFRIRKAAGAEGSYSKAGLKEILKKIYQVEKDIKTGLMEQVLALEVLISEI